MPGIAVIAAGATPGTPAITGRGTIDGAVAAGASGTATGGPLALPVGTGDAIGKPEPALTTGIGGAPPIETGATAIWPGTTGAGIDARGIISV